MTRDSFLSAAGALDNLREPLRAAPTKTLRNKLKDGISVHLVGPVADLGIGFSIEHEDAHLGGHVVRLADATETLEHSAAVVEAAIGRLQERFG